MLKNYLKIAIRNLTRNKVFSVINIAGLSLGLTCCMLIVLYTKDEVSFDRFQENKNQLYRIKVTMTDENESRTIGSTNAIHGPTFKEEIPVASLSFCCSCSRKSLPELAMFRSSSNSA